MIWVVPIASPVAATVITMLIRHMLLRPLKAAEARTRRDRPASGLNLAFASAWRTAPQRQGAGNFPSPLRAAPLAGNFPPCPLTPSLRRHAAALSAVAGSPATRLHGECTKSRPVTGTTQRRGSHE
jgi:hypothetical protein